MKLRSFYFTHFQSFLSDSFFILSLISQFEETDWVGIAANSFGSAFGNQVSRSIENSIQRREHILKAMKENPSMLVNNFTSQSTTEVEKGQDIVNRIEGRELDPSQLTPEQQQILSEALENGELFKGKYSEEITGYGKGLINGVVNFFESVGNMLAQGAYLNASMNAMERGADGITDGYRVSTGGLRNEVPLTSAQKAEALSYAKSLGVPEDVIIFSDNMNTSYKALLGSERLYIGTDVLPAAISGLKANSRISMRGAIGHEVVGHRALAGKTQVNLFLEEAQASIRAARFAPKLINADRVALIRDGIERLHSQGLKIRDVKSDLWINSAK